jgi:hypothetical protein
MNKNADSDPDFKKALMKILLDINLDFPENEYTHQLVMQIVEKANEALDTSEPPNENNIASE